MTDYQLRQLTLLQYLPLVIALLIATLGITAHYLFGQSWTTISGHALGSDDAYISFRYAENLFYGKGLVFNPSEPVEGYSNFLYTLLMVPAFYLGKGSIYGYSVLLNIVFINLSIVIYYRFIKQVIDKKSANIGVWLLALSPYIWSNAATGLETTLVLAINLGLWVTIEHFRHQKKQRDFYILLMLSTLSILTRIDGFIMPLIACLYLTIKNERHRALHLLLSIITLMICYTVCRYFYYGDIIGNTFYNKISGDFFQRILQGTVFWFYYLLETGMYISLAVYLYVKLFKSHKQITTTNEPVFISETFDFAMLTALCWSIYMIYTGGDIYYERFLITLLPMTTFLFLKVKKRLNPWLQGYLIAILLAIPLWFAQNDGRFNYQYPKYDLWVNIGEFLKSHYPNRVLAADACGKIPYYSELKTIDMLGLNDRHIAKLKAQRRGIPGHTKFDPFYVLKKSPDIITAWINPSLNVGYGLNKNLYQKHYQLHYLVNSSRHDLGDKNIIDVTTLDKKAISALINKDYNYAILTKRH
jgi:arabinofuranosyltransferase